MWCGQGPKGGVRGRHFKNFPPGSPGGGVGAAPPPPAPPPPPAGASGRGVTRSIRGWRRWNTVPLEDPGFLGGWVRLWIAGFSERQNTHKHSDTLSHSLTNTLTLSHTLSHTLTNTLTLSRTHSQTLTYTLTPSHTHTLTHSTLRDVSSVELLSPVTLMTLQFGEAGCLAWGTAHTHTFTCTHTHTQPSTHSHTHTHPTPPLAQTKLRAKEIHPTDVFPSSALLSVNRR